MAKCKKCTSKSGVHGLEDAPYMEIASAVVGGVVMGKIDELATTNADGTMKDNYFANNPTIKNAAYLAAGIALTAFMPGEYAKGAGIGIATYSGYQLVQEFMKPAAVSGLTWKPPTNIAGVNGLRTLPGNYGIAPTNIAGIYDVGSNVQQSRTMQQAQKYDQAMKTPISGLVRAL